MDKVTPVKRWADLVRKIDDTRLRRHCSIKDAAALINIKSARYYEAKRKLLRTQGVDKDIKPRVYKTLKSLVVDKPLEAVQPVHGKAGFFFGDAQAVIEFAERVYKGANQ